MKIAIGSDHGGIEMKEEIIENLRKNGVEVEDFGIYTKASCDYPDIAEKVCEAVLAKSCELGVLICGTGIGISIAANKIPGIRCAHCHDTYSAKMTRLHNNANVIAMGGRVIGPELAKEIVDNFINTPFSNDERHQRRIDKITTIEKKYVKEGK
jgi:ribose 5-phosphate isomerase B